MMITSESRRSLSLATRRAAVLLGVVNGYTSREMQDVFGVGKRLIDDDALWWQTRLHAQNRPQLTKIVLQLGLLTDDELNFDGSEREFETFIERVERDADSDLRKLSEGRKRVRAGEAGS